MISLSCHFCPDCGVRAWVIDGDRSLLDQHIRRNHR